MTTAADRTTLIRYALEENTAVVWQDASLRDWYSHAMRDIAIKTKFRLQKTAITATAGTATYARPNYDLEPESVVRGTTTLYRLDPVDFAGRTMTATGDPLYYSVLGATVHLIPVPKAGATIDYWSYRYPAPLLNATTTIDLPTEYMPVAEEYVKAKAYEQVGDWDSFKACMDNYRNMLADAITQHAFQSQSNMPRSTSEVY